jgi:hypothetical protein
MRKIRRAKNQKKTSGPQTDGRTNFVDNLLPPLVKQLHSLDKGIGMFSQCYGITHALVDAVALAKLA